MLDVITDFWKPVKKAAPQEKPDLDRLQVGSQIGFGFVPQQMLSGRRFKVTGINTYQFGDERLTSFVLSHEKEDAVSMMVLSGDGEQFLSISRRIPFADRMRMFDPAELDAVFEQEDGKTLTPREVDGGWKHWIVQSYKKEVEAVKGGIYPGDFRVQPIPPGIPTQSFEYLPLPSENNEHAIEIEKYADGRIEIYATVFRRLTDIGEVEHPQTTERLPASPVFEVIRPSPMPAAPAANPVAAPAPAIAEPAAAQPAAPEAVAEPQEHARLENADGEAEIAFADAPMVEEEAQGAADEIPQEPEAWLPEAEEEDAPVDAEEMTVETYTPMETIMAITTNGSTDSENVLKPKFGASFTQDSRAEENDAIECDLKVANKIIEEAIRNEMRLSDVVRRIIALPVSNPESVHIPVMLTESDFQLLAIRYGIPATDRVALKARIIEELGDFSGNKKQ